MYTNSNDSELILYIYFTKNPDFILEKKDIELNYEINELIEIYIKYKKLNIKNININISIDKNDDLLAH